MYSGPLSVSSLSPYRIDPGECAQCDHASAGEVDIIITTTRHSTHEFNLQYCLNARNGQSVVRKRYTKGSKKGLCRCNSTQSFMAKTCKIPRVHI